jgi:hypothetical protein
MWRDPLDSGETPSGLLDIIRETCRRRDAFIRARTSVNKKFTKQRREEDDYKAQVDEKMEKILNETSADYFPDYWLTFALFGPPAPTSKQMQIFKTQNIADMQKKIVNADDKRLNRYARSTLQKPPTHKSSTKDPACSTPLALDLTGGDSPASGMRRGKTLHVTHTVDLSNVRPNKETEGESRTRESMLEKIINTLQNAGKLADGTYILQTKITMYSEELADLMISKLNEVDDAEGDDEWMRVE